MLPEGPIGWSRSTVDPLELVACFPALSLRDGFTLHGYQYRDDSGNGNGVVWAVPAGVGFTPAEDCETPSAHFHGVPRPPRALHDFMEAIEGDGSPWSYFCASVLARELAEIGALWHGLDWTDRTIIGAAPWDRPAANDGVLGRLALDPDHWALVRGVPTDWRPTVLLGENGARVRFLTYTPSGLESITEHLDCYHHSGYMFKTTSMLLAEGRMITMY